MEVIMSPPWMTTRSIMFIIPTHLLKMRTETLMRLPTINPRLSLLPLILPKWHRSLTGKNLMQALEVETGGATF